MLWGGNDVSMIMVMMMITIIMITIDPICDNTFEDKKTEH